MSHRLRYWMPHAQILRGKGAPQPPPAIDEGLGQVRALTGNDAAALAFKQVDAHVAAVYPITPQTELMHRFAEYVANGEARTELLTVESEHSAMTAAMAASAAGARAFTATSSNGFAYMIEPYTNAGALRLPVVMSLVNGHMGGFQNIHNDHSDAMLGRSACWIQLHAENAQETYDNLIQAFRIGEDPRVRLPVMACHDGFLVSHTLERLRTLDDEQVRRFVGPYVPIVDLLDTDHPQAVGPLLLPDYAFQFYAQVGEVMRGAPDAIREIGQEYGRVSGRTYDLLEAYRMEDAEVAVLGMGSVCGTVRVAVDILRREGVKAGLVKLRVFRPFPAEALARELSRPGLAAVAVLDRTIELGNGGPLFHEAAAALAVRARATGAPLPLLMNVILGIGGRDVRLSDINGIFKELLEAAADGPASPDVTRYLDVGGRGDSALPLHESKLYQDGTVRATNVVMLARGGQGARTASYLLAELMIEAGLYAQGFPMYGPERTGAPVKAFAKISDRPIRDRQQIYAPDVIAVFDETLLEAHEAVFSTLPPKGVILANTKRSPAAVRASIGLEGRHVYTIDATGIAMAEFQANRPNAAMLAALIRIFGWCSLEAFKEAFARKMKRLPEAVLAGNLRAIDRAAAAVSHEG